ncbi:CapA family protein [Corynebacterium sp. Q4381]|uniref:CapA family protein n=1 Tax=Corynebacterium sp. Marseille-Q4381 TaxID=3121597 RepID=UPI002FE681D9
MPALLTGLCAAALGLTGCAPDPAPEPAATLTTTAEPAAEPVHFTIRTVGDILIHSDVYNTANRYAGGEGYDFGPMFDEVRDYLQNADITTGNLEVPVAGAEFGLSGYPAFNAPPQIVDALQDAGVDIVNNATNHTLDRGGDGVVASVSNLRERGMLYAGGYDSWEDKATPRVIDVNGVKVGFLGYSYGTNGIPVPEGREYSVALIDDAMPDEITALDDDVDMTVVMIHMGEEYEPLPVQFQRDTAQTAVDAGADLVLGGHPHVVQPFELVAGGTPVWWSHGNFLHGQWDERTKVGGIGEFAFTRSADGAVTLDRIRFMPTYTVGPPISYEHKVLPLVRAHEYIDVAATFAELRERLGPDVEIVEYLD